MRINPLASLLLAFVALAVFASTGCDKAADDGHAAHGDDGHSHDDDHDHADDHPAHGPFGGHIVALDTSDVQLEWKKYKDNDVIKMYILDAAGKKESPIKVDSFIVMPKVGNDGTGFTLEAEEADDDGLAAVYTLDNKDLSIAIPLGVDIEIKAGDKVYKGEIKAHKPLDH